jgi:hypothetical protein
MVIYGPFGLIHRHPSTKLHSVTSRKTVILTDTAVITSNLTERNGDQSNSINTKVKIWYKYCTSHIWFISTMLPWERNRFLFGIPLLVAECRKTIKFIWSIKLVSTKRAPNARTFIFAKVTTYTDVLHKLSFEAILEASIVWNWNIQIHRALLWDGWALEYRTRIKFIQSFRG